jgi:uncharacterized protein YecT (DUF1311 family)
MLRLTLIFALTLLACAPVRADEMEGYDAARVQTCVASAGGEREALRRCIGASASPCVDAEGPATFAYVLCWSREADTWRQLMDAAAARLSAEQSYRDPQRYAAATTAWEAWVEAECEYWAWQEGGGSGEQADRVVCAANATAERAITLLVAAAP